LTDLFAVRSTLEAARSRPPDAAPASWPLVFHRQSHGLLQFVAIPTLRRMIGTNMIHGLAAAGFSGVSRNGSGVFGLVPVDDYPRRVVMTELIEDPPRDRSVAGPGSATTAVLLAEDFDLLRDALVCLLGRQSDLSVVAALKCRPDTVLSMALRYRPDVAVVDIGTSSAQGMAVVRQLRRRLPECQVVALVPLRHPEPVRQLLAAEVRVVIDSDAPTERLLQAIHGAAQAEVVVDLQLALAALRVRPNPLTPLEQGVLRLAAVGESSPAIARQLHLSAGTVRNYLSHAISKTQARTRVEAIRIANEAGWL
jgi:two-component system, NarL family, response regulator DesR